MNIYRWLDEESVLGHGGIILAESEKIAREKLLQEIHKYTTFYQEDSLKTWSANNDDDSELFKRTGILITY